MIRINLISGSARPHASFTEYLIPRVTGRKQGFLESSGSKVCSDSRKNPVLPNENQLPTVKPSPLSPELRDRLMGKAPLRLIQARTKLHPNCWKEKLECGHELVTFADFYWDDKSHLVNLEPSAKRRRCQECKEIALALPPRKPVSPVSPKKEKSA